MEKQGIFIDGTTVHQFLNMVEQKMRQVIKETNYHKEENQTFSLKQSSEILGISVNTLKRRIFDGLISQRPDKRISKSEIERFKSMR